MKDRMQEAYSATFNSALAKLIEGFAPGASVSRKRQRGSGMATASMSPAVMSAPGTAKASANYGGNNSVSRPPDAPTPTPAKLSRPPVKRWEGGVQRKKRPGIAPVKRYTGKRATIGGRV